jgi:hypothetical protein
LCCRLNIRYLGYLREEIKKDYLKKIFLSEIVARVVKNILRERLRIKMRFERGMIAEKSCIDVVVETFNMVLQNKNFENFSENLENKVYNNKKFKNEDESSSYYSQYDDDMDSEEENQQKIEQKFETISFFDNSSKSLLFWSSQKLKDLIEENFPSSLSHSESRKDFDLKHLIDLSFIFKRIQEMMGITIDPSSKNVYFYCFIFFFLTFFLFQNIFF